MRYLSRVTTDQPLIPEAGQLSGAHAPRNTEKFGLLFGAVSFLLIDKCFLHHSGDGVFDDDILCGLVFT